MDNIGDSQKIPVFLSSMIGASQAWLDNDIYVMCS